MKLRALLFFLLAPLLALRAEREITIYISANLGGRFPMDDKIQENRLLRTAAIIRAAKAQNPNVFYFDMGNVFFPGRLSRFSFGSLTADYLQMVGLDAGLVAAGDLNIGAESLDYIRRARGIRLLSANIFRDKTPFFEPFAVIKKQSLKVGVLGLTSNKTLVSAAEARILNLRLDTNDGVIEKLLGNIQAEKPDLTIALSGLSLQSSLKLQSAHAAIDLLVSGGDGEDVLYDEPIRSIELSDTRRAVTFPKNTSLLRLVLKEENERWVIREYTPIDVDAVAIDVDTPVSFLRRLTLWQKGYAASEGDNAKEARFTPFLLTPQFAAGTLRESFGCDVAFIEPDDVDSSQALPIKKKSDVRYRVLNDYNIFTFRLMGDTLQKFYAQSRDFVFSGMEKDSITGYPVRNNVSYRICATQRGYETASTRIGKDLQGNNQWLGLTDTVLQMVDERTTDPNKTADNRFRFLTIFNLSNIYETGNVSNSSNIVVPPGQATASYFKWGLENDVNFLLYNRKHSISFNPYIFYVRQSDTIVRNLLRGDLTYVYNTEWFLRPYQKSRFDTVVVPTAGQRPSILRETVGGEFKWHILTGRLGVGLEKEIVDPATPVKGGIEANVGILWDLFSGIQYKLFFDAFSSRSLENFWNHRLEMSNSLIFTIMKPLTFTVSHRLYYLYQGLAGDFYNSSIVTFSLDMRTTWKEP